MKLREKKEALLKSSGHSTQDAGALRKKKLPPLFYVSFKNPAFWPSLHYSIIYFVSLPWTNWRFKFLERLTCLFLWLFKKLTSTDNMRELSNILNYLSDVSIVVSFLFEFYRRVVHSAAGSCSGFSFFFSFHSD